MKDNILSICLGNDFYNLNGSKNDAILFYNYLNLLYKNNNLKQNWYKPKFFLDNNVAEDNIVNYLRNFKNKVDKVLIFFSGHGLKDGKLKIKTKNSNYIDDLNLLNILSKNIQNSFELYIILDCCYSGSFKIIPNQKMKSIKLMASCDKDQLSNEGITSFENLIKENKLNYFKSKITKKKDNVIIGIFTYNIIDLLYKLKLDDINEWVKIFNLESFWKKIYEVTKQKPILFWKY